MRAHMVDVKQDKIRARLERLMNGRSNCLRATGRVSPEPISGIEAVAPDSYVRGAMVVREISG